ncbi:MAG: hypothetical protein GY854_11030 [Deltaproteobacteria bacterium]|nr:hypothetical protein [Deltaproteobacteria bacterium]
MRAVRAAKQTRENLKALKKNKAAGALKGRQIVELTNERMELKVVLEEILSDLILGG